MQLKIPTDFVVLATALATWLVCAPFQLLAEGMDSPADDYVVQSWGTDAGLPDSTVTSIAQTPDGYIWVGTLHGGLARFDGAKFINFHPANTPALKSIEIHKLLVDGAGTLWIGNVEGGLTSYRDGIFNYEYANAHTPQSWLDHLISPPGRPLEMATLAGWIFRREAHKSNNEWETFIPLDSNQGSMTCEDHDGVIWYYPADHVLTRVIGTNMIRLPHPPGLRNLQIRVLATDRSGQVWVGTDKELAIWDGKTFVDMTPTNGRPDVAVRGMVFSTNGLVWVRTDDSLQLCADRRWIGEPIPWSGDPRTTSHDLGLLPDSSGGVWMAHYGEGLWHIDRKGQVSKIDEHSGLPNAMAESWLEDREGNLWVGLTDGGLACVRPRIFHVLRMMGGSQSQAIHTLCEDSEGAMWFGAAGSGIQCWQNNVFTNFIPPEATSGHDTSVLPATGGGVWVGTVGKGLFRLKRGKFQAPFPAVDIGTVVRCMYEDHGGALWIGSEFGLFCWSQWNLKSFTAADGFSPAYVLSIAEDKDGDIWAGTALGELRHYHAGKFETFLPGDSLTDPATLKAAVAADPMESRDRGALSGGERFWSLLFDKEGVLWVGSLGGGLLRFHDGKFTRFSTREGLPNENVSQILEDDHGQLWLGMRSGIARVSVKELTEFAKNPAQSPHFVSYGKFDGLPALECSGGSQPTCWRSRDGKLWFATVKGAVWVDPDVLHVNRQPPVVKMDEIWVDGRQIVEGKPLPTQPNARPPTTMRTTPGKHYFEFKFCALNFTSPDKVKFRWRLKGLENNWVQGDNRQSVSYDFIPPGSYHFEVQACNNDSDWSSQGATVSFTVPPYFWQTWWFKVLVAVACAGGLAAIYSARIARLRVLEKLRLRIARDLHDEVGANLGSISLLAQVMEQHPSSADASQVRQIAVQTVDTLRDIIWFIDPTHDRLSDLVIRLQETARLMLPGIACQFEADGDFNSTRLPLVFRRNVLPLFKEVLHNVQKHSQATEVKIFVSHRENRFQLRVQDNGAGFQPARRSSGNGLKNMKRRAQDVAGRLEIESAPGKGTDIIFTASITQTRDWWGQKVDV